MFPDHIKTIALVAPAGKLDREIAGKGIAVLENAGYRVKQGKHLWGGSSQPFLSATAEARAEDLTSAWLDEEVDLIMCLRGGFGSAHILPLLDWSLLKKRNMPVAGYSDITALHFAMLRMGAGTPVAAPMVGKLPELDEYTRKEMFNAFTESARKIRPLQNMEFLKPGQVKARPVVGNLAVAASLCGTPYLPDCRGRIIVLEELNEAPYRVDRYITQLEQSGFFDGCAGIALGEFLDCGEPEVLKNIFIRLTVLTDGPVVMNFPFGHIFPIQSLNFSQEMII